MADTEHGHILEMIPSYALGCLDASEIENVERHLDSCVMCQAELNTYEAVVNILPLSAPDVEPSAALKGRLLARIGPAAGGHATSEEAAIVARSEEPPGLSWWGQTAAVFRNMVDGPRWRPAILMIVLALVVSNVILWQQLNAPDPNSWRRVRLAGSEVAPEARGIIYISADGRNGTIIVDQLPLLSQEQQYQLWLIQDGQRTSGAVFSVDNEGYRGLQIESPLPLEEYSAFGITIEPAGGSIGPTGDKVLGYSPED